MIPRSPVVAYRISLDHIICMVYGGMLSLFLCPIWVPMCQLCLAGVSHSSHHRALGLFLVLLLFCLLVTLWRREIRCYRWYPREWRVCVHLLKYFNERHNYAFKSTQRKRPWPNHKCYSSETSMSLCLSTSPSRNTLSVLYVHFLSSSVNPRVLT